MADGDDPKGESAEQRIETLEGDLRATLLLLNDNGLLGYVTSIIKVLKPP